MINAILEYMEYLAEVKKTSPNTEASYKRDLMKLKNWLNEKGIHSFDKVSAMILRTYVAYLQDMRLSPATISRNIAAIRSFFIYASQYKLTATNPARELKAPKVDRKTPEPLSTEEVQKLMEQPDTATAKGLRDKAMLELIYATGMHVGELIHLSLSDLDLEASSIRCKETKRVLTLDAGTTRILKAYVEDGRVRLLGRHADEGALFVNCQGGGMSRQGFWKLLKGYVALTDITAQITPHTLRHAHNTAQPQENGTQQRTQVPALHQRNKYMTAGK